MDWTSLFNNLGGSGGTAPGVGPGGFGVSGGTGFNWNQLANILGRTGAAISPKDSWQRGLGEVGAGIASSNIYSKAQAKAAQEKNAYMDSMIKALGGLTPDGETGPTSVTQNADGTFTMKGNVSSAPGVTPQTKVGGVGQENLTLGSPPGGGSYWGDPSKMSPSVAGNINATDPYAPLLKALVGFQGSSAGLTSADYAGLTPEMIDALAGRQMQGQRQGLETLAFLNEMLGPKAGRVIEGPENYMLVDEITGKVRDLGIPVYRTQEYKAPHTIETGQGIMQWNPNSSKWESTGMNPYRAPSNERSPWSNLTTIEYYDSKTGTPGAWTGTYAEANAKRAELQKQGMVLGNAPTPPKAGEITEQEGVAAANLGVIRDPEASESSRKAAIHQWNTASPNSTYAYIWNKDKELPQRVILPKKPDGSRYILSTITKAAVKNGRTIEEELRAKGLIQ